VQQNVVEASLYDTTSNSLNSRALCFAPAESEISGIVLSYPQWYFKGGELDWPQSYTVTAAIEYPAGRFAPVYHAGHRSMAVVPGLGQVAFDPCAISIPAGKPFFVRTFATWNPGRFPLSSGVADDVNAGEFCRLGINEMDLTLRTANPGQTSYVSGFAPSVYGHFATPMRVLGVMGDSISRAVGPDSGDPLTNAYFIRRAIRNVFPVMDVNRSGDGFTAYFRRHDGRDALLRNEITDLIVGFCRNDLASGANWAKTRDQLRLCIDPYLTAGVACRAFTALPTTHSTDGWATKDNQVIALPAAERERVAYNDWLRSSWRAIGLKGIFDVAAAVEGSAVGFWNADGASGHNGGGYAVLARGAVERVQLGLGGHGAAYPANAKVPCAVLNQAGDRSGHSASVVANTDGNGVVTSFTVLDGGSGYTQPPWIAPHGAWTNDGVHPDKRGYDAIIVGAGISPLAFGH
jgi:hypothetical protein